MIGDWGFIKSRRFWCLILIAFFKVLEAEKVFTAEITNAIITVLSGFIVVRTVDKITEK